MSDICCARCGEPWDSTGGLHYTHSDLREDAYTALLEGRGCPCCEGDPIANESWDNGDYTTMTDDELKERQAACVAAWRHSVEALSEGDPEFMFESFEQAPKPPYDDLTRYEM